MMGGKSNIRERIKKIPALQRLERKQKKGKYYREATYKKIERKVADLMTDLNNEKHEKKIKRKKAVDTFEESLKFLKAELKKCAKKPEVSSFHLIDRGLKAKIDFNSLDGSNASSATISPLFTEDVYHLLLGSVLGHQSPFPLNFAKLEKPQDIRKTVLLVVEGFSKSDVLQNLSKLTHVTHIFPYAVQILSSNVHFATELCSLHISTDYHLRKKGSYSAMFPKEREIKVENSEDLKRPSKLHLLLSPIQMAMENMPFPPNLFSSASETQNYVYTKKSYSPVTANSPMYALDCEMCLTTAGKYEVTEVAIVDENHDVIYYSLVKPHNRIVNFLTRYSGITKERLTDVNVRLSDVQQHIRTILPNDAILCGQSLNFDLHALNMIHPYIIDTSVIFCNGKDKTSLKNLTMQHLQEEIQDVSRCHNPVEDSIATMKLVQLKLANDIRYGDACFDSRREDGVNSNKPSNGKIEEDANLKRDGFFTQLSKSSKKTCLIGDKKTLTKYTTALLNDHVHKYTKSSTEKILSTSLQHMNDFDFVVSHVTFDLASNKDSVAELNEAVKQLHDSCVENTTFMILLSCVNEEEFEDVKNGLLLVKLINI